MPNLIPTEFLNFKNTHMRFGFSRFKSKKEFTKLVDSLWEKPHVKRKDHGNYWPLQSGLVWQKDDT